MTFLYVGRLAPRKSPGIFIRAAAQLVQRRRREDRENREDREERRRKGREGEEEDDSGGNSDVGTIKIKFRVVGEGALLDDMIHLAERLGLTVHTGDKVDMDAGDRGDNNGEKGDSGDGGGDSIEFLAGVPPQEVPGLMGAKDTILVHPTVR